MPLSNRQIKALKPGLVYEIKHERKGTFVGKFVGYDDEPQRLGDKKDKVLLHFVFDIRVGTSQEHMATGVKTERGALVPTRNSNLRPSLIEEIRQTEKQEWLLDVKTPKVEKPQQEPGFLDRLLGR